MGDFVGGDDGGNDVAGNGEMAVDDGETGDIGGTDGCVKPNKPKYFGSISNLTGSATRSS